MAGILHTRRTATAYERPGHAVRHLRDASDAAVVAAEGLADGRVRFQGHVLTAGDLLATWAVELVVHHHDLGEHLDVGEPDAAALELALATAETLAGGPAPGGLVALLG